MSTLHNAIVGVICSTLLAANGDSPAMQPATLAPLEWETGTLEPGAPAFLDRDYTIENVPDALAGTRFIRSAFCSTRKVCEQAGEVLVITPVEAESDYTRAPELLQRGFERMGVPPFKLFGGAWPIECAVYRKHMAPAERLDMRTPLHRSMPERAPWAIVIADTPAPSGAIASLKSLGRSVFDPPLAQDHTVAAKVPDPRTYFVHDPGMCVLPDGTIIVASPIWGRGSRGTGEEEVSGPQYLHMSRSRDGGKTWERLDDLPYAEGTPFVVDGVLHMFTQPRQHQDVYFMRSHDQGDTWEGPVKVFEGAFWNCQTSMVTRDGTLYWVLDRKHQAVLAIAGDTTKDLLVPSSWRRSEVVTAPPVPREFRMNQAEPGGNPNRLDWTLETNLMLVEGRIMGACRVNSNTGAIPHIAALWEVKDDGDELTIEFQNYAPWPGGYCKFCIVHDETTGMFWMATNLTLGAGHERLGHSVRAERSMLMLYYGFDGMTWLPAGCIARAPDSTQSFMYPSMRVDRDDLVVLSRTGRESGDFHDADRSTFHRIENFRELAWY